MISKPLNLQFLLKINTLYLSDEVSKYFTYLTHNCRWNTFPKGRLSTGQRSELSISWLRAPTSLYLQTSKYNFCLILYVCFFNFIMQFLYIFHPFYCYFCRVERQKKSKPRLEKKVNRQRAQLSQQQQQQQRPALPHKKLGVSLTQQPRKQPAKTTNQPRWVEFL